MRRLIVGAVLGLAALSAGLPCSAGSATSGFSVRITLSNPAAPGAAEGSGICTSESLSEKTGALVRVVCASGQFVSIGPRPGGRFVDTHGGAYEYYFGPLFGAANRSGYGEFAQGSGTIASFRVYSVEENDGPLDMLVSF